jgi:predicted transcriptional regulator
MDMQDMANTLRNEVKASGLSMKMLSELSGVNRISLMRFMREETDLNLSAASRLADFFDLELQPKRTKKRGK